MLHTYVRARDTFSTYLVRFDPLLAGPRNLCRPFLSSVASHSSFNRQAEDEIANGETDTGLEHLQWRDTMHIMHSASFRLATPTACTNVGFHGV